MSPPITSYLGILEPKSENKILHETVSLQAGTVPFPLSLVHSVVLWECLDLQGLEGGII